VIEPRASHPERPPALHLLLTREAPEQKEPNRLLTDTGESSEHPAHPTTPGQRGTQQAQSPRWSDCSCNDRTAHQANNPTSAILIPCQPSREPTHRETTTRTPDSQRRQLRYLRPQQRPYIIPRSTGKKSPQYSLRDPPSPPDMAIE
ncbi:Hypothetical protein GSB_152915, partial [Giardia duodenalis]